MCIKIKKVNRVGIHVIDCNHYYFHGVPSGLGADSEEPFIITAPGEDSEDAADEPDGEQDGDEESTSDESLFE